MVKNKKFQKTLKITFENACQKIVVRDDAKGLYVPVFSPGVVVEGNARSVAVLLEISDDRVYYMHCELVT